jgi:hypothetical protein
MVLRVILEHMVNTDECWIWARHLNPQGYGRVIYISHGKRYTAQAHRVMYEAMVGPIGQGMVLDHLCRVHQCVNPSHLEPVSTRENILRGQGTSAVNAKKNTCSKGHAYDSENTWLKRRGNRVERVCRICYRTSQREIMKRRYYRLKSQLGEGS